jgi:Cof subfamily protein (haloacid dehalogenase superfamily)
MSAGVVAPERPDRPDRPERPEPRLPIRLLALDIDGTLVGDDMAIRDRTVEAIRAAVRRGIPVSLATGRMASSARLFADALGLREPIIAYQGALIRAIPPLGAVGRAGRPAAGRLLWHRPLPAAVAREALLWCRERGLEPHVNHLERFIVRADDPRADDYSTFLGARAELVEDLVAYVRHPVTKIIAMGEAGVPAAVLGEARERFAGRAAVTLSHPRFIEFIAPGISKGRGVRWLARRAGVPLEQVLAIGDQWNDLEMLSAVGHGAAMPSAPPEVRLAARYVAPPLRVEGAAILIEDLVLAGQRAAARNRQRWRLRQSSRMAAVSVPSRGAVWDDSPAHPGNVRRRRSRPPRRSRAR